MLYLCRKIRCIRMEHRKLRFALLGNIYQAKKSASIQKVLSTITNYGAELYVDKEYYYFLKDQQRLDVKATKVFSDDGREGYQGLLG